MAEHLEHAAQLFEYQLGSALRIETDARALCTEFASLAQDAELTGLFTELRHVAGEQIDGLGQAFGALGVNPVVGTAATQGIVDEVESLIELTSGPVIDAVMLSAALSTMRLATAAYDSLIIAASSLGATDVEELMRANLARAQASAQRLEDAARGFGPFVATV